MIEIYNRIKGEDPDFIDGLLDLSNELKIYLQQIKSILGAESGTILGAVDMPMNIEELVYETNLSTADIEKRLYEKISTYCTLYQRFTTVIKVNFFKGNQRDIVIIDFIINNEKKLEFRIK